MLPLGFIILTPELFIPAYYSLETANKVLQIHELLQEYAFVPFIAAATGLGISVGCLKVLNFRIQLLTNIRKMTLLSFHLRTYDLSWDSFLSRLKRNARITVGLARNNDTVSVHGNLINFSIKNEPQSIVLANPDIKEYDNNIDRNDDFVKRYTFYTC